MIDVPEVPAGIALVATDLDGTLLHEFEPVPPRTRAALAAARAEGLPVVFVTGRPPRWMPVVVESTGHAQVAVCANGAVLLDCATWSVLQATGLDHGTLGTAVGLLRGAHPTVRFAVEVVGADGQASFGVEPGYAPRWPVPDGTPVADVAELARLGTVVKLLARLDATSGHDADSFLLDVEPLLAGVVSLTHGNSRDRMLEIAAPGVSKAATLASYAASLGIGPDQAVAVGDMLNDAPMLAWAGTSFAVAGGHPAALEAARGRTVPGPAQEGVAALIEAVLARR